MSYLKLIVNATWSGAYCSFLVAFLVLFINHDPGLRPLGEVLHLLPAIALVYLPATCLVFPTLFVCLRFFAARTLGIGWVSLKAIVWFGVVVLGTMTAVFYQNIRWSESLVSPRTREDMRLGSAIMLASLIVAAGMASLGQIRVRSRVYRRLGGAALLVPLVVLPFLLRGDHVPRPVKGDSPMEVGLDSIRPSADPDGRYRLLLVGIHAASMDSILPLVSARELPTLERLLKEGASSRLDTLRPCRTRVAWTTIMAGMPPWSTGIKDNHSYRLPGAPWLGTLPRFVGMGRLAEAGYVDLRPQSTSTSRFRLFPDMMRASGYDLELAGWAGLFEEERAPESIHPRDPRVTSRLASMIGSPGTTGHQALEGILRGAIAADLTVQSKALESLHRRGGGQPRILATRFPGLGAISAYFLRYHIPGEFGDVTAEERAAYGMVIPMYYKFLDEMLGEQVAAAGTDAAVMVISPHGVEPISWWERSTGDSGPEGYPERSGSWLRGPDGILFIRGEGVSAGAKLDEASLLDVLPTCLYMLGLPIRRDMPGDLLRRLFEREFRETHPVLFVPGRS